MIHRDTAEEIRRLERCVTDLSGILSLPALWSGRGAQHVIDTLLVALHRTLRLDFAYARLSMENGAPPIEMMAPGDQRPAPGAGEIGAMLTRSWTRGGLSTMGRIANPIGSGEVSVVRCGIDLEEDEGVLFAVSARRDFPTRSELLVLRVAADQAGIGIREARARSQQRREHQRVEDERLALAALVEHSSDFIAMATPDGRVFFLNPAGCELVGLGCHEAGATHVLDYVAKEDGAHYEAHVLPTLLAEGRWEGETRFRNFRTGASILMLQNAFVIRDPDHGRPLALATISRDITQRKRTEESLRESERRFRLLAEAIPHQVWSFLPDGSVDYCNQRGMEYSDLTPEEAQAGGWGVTVHPADLDAAMAAWRDARAKGSPCEVEQRLRGRDGRYRRFLSRAVPVWGERGEIIRWFATHTDIEERRRAEEALRDAQTGLAHASRLTVLGELAASLAHELNQPLAAVVTNGGACLRWLDRDTPDLGEARIAVKRMIRDANRAAQVIARMRAMLKKSGLNRTRLDLVELIREVLVLVRPEIQRHRAVLRETLAVGLPPVLGDRVQLQQVLLNLILNAAEAMTCVEEGPRVLTIRAECDETPPEGDVLVSVQDVGVGVKAENRERLFEPFFTTKRDGLGLGLAISRSIIEAHGGRLWATGNDGPGTTLRFLLPSAAAGR